MSVVVVKKTKGLWQMASDSFVVNQNGDEAGIDIGRKMFSYGPATIGFVGDFRPASIFRFDLPLIDRPKRGVSKLHWLHNVASKFREVCGDKSHLTIDNGSEINNEFLILLGGHLFAMDSNFAVAELKVVYHAIGAGGSYAMGAMFAGGDITVAVGAAIANCNSVGGRVHVVKEGQKL